MAIRTMTRVVAPAPSRRRQRYQSDPTYRENAKSMSRRSYRKRNSVELDTCLHSLQFLGQAGQMRDVRLPNGKMREMHTFSLPETAAVLQKLYQTVWRWVNTDMIPAPILLTAVDTAKPYTVYHINEVRALIEIIGKHEQTVRYFRKDHREVRKRIEDKLNTIRKTFK